MGEVQTRPSATVIPFPDPATREPRRAAAADEPRGTILLFMGVRYERMADPPPAADDHEQGRRRTS